MQQFKIDLFEKATGQTFPEYSSLNKIDAQKVVVQLCKAASINDANMLYEHIIETSKCKEGKEDYAENLSEIVADLNFPSVAELYIIWDNETVDVMKAEDVICYWTDIFFSMGDEAVLLYSRVQDKYLLITHWNNVYYN